MRAPLCILFALVALAGCTKSFGQPCTQDSDCGPGLCGQNRLCSKTCAKDADCGPGWTCPPQLEGPRFCICSPQPEIPDGKDNDCDGQIDEKD